MEMPIYIEMESKEVRDTLRDSKTIWRLYQNDRKKFVEHLILIDGSRWPKYMLTMAGETFKIEPDGHMWWNVSKE